ncbi:short-chain dehydrogenase [Trametes versicolor FP-101664 SS1]|uniref:Short-chain dehydrogenase n=1 Tax=Trametes versicolor (strain FP-101664) TaxID=717944 RepID=R7S9A1_TRAVS|nr:short-chain dehydrogenase [Trametes versicolor FP-101664 SS1]EIW51539.1 short-chain dehydrogenase [Trametes versicolor FP-101664 SS1]
MHLNKIFDLTGRIALVTGGGTGIGWQIALGLAENGAKVYITGRRQEVLEKSASTFAEGHTGNGSIIPLVMDVTDRSSIAAARDTFASKESRLHILVNNAGQTGPVSRWFEDPNAPERKDADTIGRALFEGESFESWGDLYKINTFSVFFVTTAFLGLLAAGTEESPSHTSAVINVTSVSGLMKLSQNHFAYNSAKAAASHLTKMMATEFALKKVPVRVCAVAPGVWESEMTFDSITDDLVDKVSKAVVPVPTRRSGKAEEIAGTVIYLASPAGCFTNGQEIVVDGGFLAVNPSTV